MGRQESRHYGRGPNGCGWTGGETPAAPLADVDNEPDLDSLKKDELVSLADERGVDSSGTKADILARLQS